VSIAAGSNPHLSAPSSRFPPVSRRAFVGGAVGGIGLLTFIVAGCERKLTPEQAKAEQVPLRTLTAPEAQVLEALGEILLPGSAQAGIANYLDQQLSGPPHDSMLIVKYLGVSPPFTEFYRTGLSGVQNAAHTAYGKSLAELDAQQGAALVHTLASGAEVKGWSGPPAGLFYFALRSDAIDVVYGTQRGFDTLKVPYMAHIVPPSRWGE
jgi:Gluconate 2-dehydrogenase subunit 3